MHCRDPCQFAADAICLRAFASYAMLGSWPSLCSHMALSCTIIVALWKPSPCQPLRGQGPERQHRPASTSS